MYTTAKIVIENNLDSIEPLTAFIANVAEQLQLNEKESYRICYAVEESLQKSILFDFEEGERQEIEVIVSRIASGLKVSISDHGIPKNPFKKSIKSVEDIVEDISFESIAKNDSDELDAISDFVIHKLLDRYSYINRGKEGRSIEMLIFASNARIGEESQENESTTITGEFSLLRKALHSDMTGISRLFYKSYGYSYVNDVVYYPERLEKAIEKEQLISTVALSTDKRVIGHVALMQPYEDSKITEWGMAISDPLFRGKGIMSQLIEIVMSDADASKYKGIFAHSVTNHAFTQKICAAHNFSDVALLVGYAGSDLSFKNIHNTLAQRESTIISFKTLKPFANRDLFLPPKHAPMIQKLYKGIGVEVHQKAPSPEIQISPQTQLRDTIISSVNIAEIVLEKVGDDILELLKFTTKKICIAKVDVLYLFINLEDSLAVELVEEFTQIGYIFGGIFPYYHHEHTLVLQYFNNIKFDYKLIESLSPLAKELKEYVKSFDI